MLQPTDILKYYTSLGQVISCTPFGNGHINDTFSLATTHGRYVLQRINHTVFRKPREVMHNVMHVTAHIRQDRTRDERATLTVVMTDTDEPLVETEDGTYWRVYRLIENTTSREAIASAADFATCGHAFGAFQASLADFPAHTLYETIVNFHNTPVRLDALKNAIRHDVCGRVAAVHEEIAFALAREDFAHTLERAREAGTLPLRVTHNDTKLNNVLFDTTTGQPVCVIDLDTVMPGYSVNDFGDMIRSGATTAAEDETDLSLVSLDMQLFRAGAEGFIRGCGDKLTEQELDLLPIGAMMMTYECGIRFLTDYLEGDVYFKIHKENHNLDRCRNQFALLRDMEQKKEQMDHTIRTLKAIL